jgi:peptidoglycan-N-acetylglucosamine deacetylase
VTLCAVSVDLDEIAFYHRIHGLGDPDGTSANAVYDVALGRLGDLARAHDLPLTLFVIGVSAERPENAARLRALADQGHEIGNHTYSHPYDLTRLDTVRMAEEVHRAQEAIERATGRRPVGFRAPGYTVSDALFGVLERSGFVYDSSVFPCPAYWALKAAAISVIGLLGRRSQSIIDTPLVLTAPTGPYHVGRPYWRTGAGMTEIPIQVTDGLRAPFIGTSLTMAGPSGARLLARMVAGAPAVNLELHGIDLLDESDGLSALRPHQRDVGIPVARKLRAISTAIGVLRERGYEFVRLDELAQKAASPA